MTSRLKTCGQVATDIGAVTRYVIRDRASAFWRWLKPRLPR